MDADMATVSLLQWIIDAGTTGILLLGVYAFMRGWIISAKNYDKALEAQQKIAEKTAEIMAEELCKKIEEAVTRGTERGLVRGYLKMNGGDKENDNK